MKVRCPHFAPKGALEFIEAIRCYKYFTPERSEDNFFQAKRDLHTA